MSPTIGRLAPLTAAFAFACGPPAPEPCDRLDEPPVVEWRLESATLPSPGLASAVAHGGAAYVATADGFYRFAGRGAELEALTPPASPRPAPLVSDGSRIYLIGGGAEEPGRTEVDVYDPGSDSWTPGPALPEPRSRHSALWAEGRLLVLGGADALDEVGKMTLWVLEEGAWVEGPRMLARTYWGQAVAHQDRVMMLGGFDTPGLAARFGTQVLEDDTWTSGPDLFVPRGMGAATSVCEWVVLYTGREDDTLVDLRWVELLDPETGETFGSRPPNRTRSAAGTAVIDGELFVFGGYTLEEEPSFYTATIERGTPVQRGDLGN